MEIILFCLNYLLTTTFGVAVHFIHQTFRHSFLGHVFGAVNESTWEHLKLAFWPMLFSAIIRRLFLPWSEISNFWFAVAVAILVTIIAIPLLYYAIKSLTQKEITWVSIGIYYLAVLLGLLSELWLMQSQFGNNSSGKIIILSLIACFVLFTWKPPRNFLFKDPVKNRYGDFN